MRCAQPSLTLATPCSRRRRAWPIPGVGGFAQCVVAGGLVYVSGQTAIDEQWNVVATDFAGQARQVMANLERALEAAGSSLGDIVSMTAFFSHPGYVREFGEIRKAAMGARCARAPPSAASAS